MGDAAGAAITMWLHCVMISTALPFVWALSKMRFTFRNSYVTKCG